MKWNNIAEMINPEPEIDVRVIAAVICRDGRYLVCRRPWSKRHGGLWEFPGGKCEKGESQISAVRRELREELDVEVTSIGKELFSIRDAGSNFRIEFLEVHITGEPVCLEHIALKWALAEELATIALAPSDRKFLLLQHPNLQSSDLEVA